MDSAAAVTPASCIVEQAIFTSHRSPMGEGYRVVAASSGVDVDHKREITRRSPSHDSMCGTDADARATSVYPLSGGRVCVSISGHAGKEHTGRGGLRVYTHLAILDDAAYDAFGCMPTAVEHAVVGVIGEHFDPKPPKRIEPAQLACGNALLPIVPSEQDDQRVAVIAAALIEGRRVVVTHAPDARDVMNWVMMALPRGGRRTVTMSAGLKVSPARDFQLVVVEGDAGKRVPEGYCIMNWDMPPEMLRTPYRGWFEFVQRLWRSGRASDVRDLTHRLATVDAQMLQRVASVCDDLEAVPNATAEELVTCAARHPRGATGTGAYGDLVNELHEAMQRRSEALTRAAEAAAQAREQSS